MNDLFPEMGESLSPKLRWLRQFCIATHYSNLGYGEDEMKPWVGWFYPKGHESPIDYLVNEMGTDPMEQQGLCKYGNTKEEVLQALYDEWDGNESYLKECGFSS